MKTHVIIKTHESALKGKNRPMFMRRLADNVRRAVEGTGVERVWLAHMMVGVTMSRNTDWDAVRERIGDCMGVAKFFPATETPLDIDAVKELIATEIKGRRFDTFRISAHRSDKKFPIKSVQINEELGTFVLGLTDSKVHQAGSYPTQNRDPVLHRIEDIEYRRFRAVNDRISPGTPPG